VFSCSTLTNGIAQNPAGCSSVIRSEVEGGRPISIDHTIVARVIKQRL
jgi:hypothetical protein